MHRETLERFVLWLCLFLLHFLKNFLEDISLLDHDDLLDVYALHFVFLPIIQRQLDTFREGWAHHPL